MEDFEKSKLAPFSNLQLSKQQVEIIIGRQITSNEYKAHLGKPIKKHKKTKNQKSMKKVEKFVNKYYKEMALLKLKENLKLDVAIRSKRETRLREKFKSIAEEAAEKGKKLYTKAKLIEEEKQIILNTTNYKDYKIVKISDKYIPKFKIRESKWTINGDIDIFDIRKALKSLLNKMTQYLNPNYHIQIAIINKGISYRTNYFKMNSEDLIDALQDRLDTLAQYPDFDINNVIF